MSEDEVSEDEVSEDEVSEDEVSEDEVSEDELSGRELGAGSSDDDGSWSDDGSWKEEEPWERDIAALLASLPDVEPPAGFMQRAVDHRPLFALRSTAALAVAACIVLAVTVRWGVVEREGVVPPIGELVARHVETEAALRGGVPLPLQEADRTPLSLPGQFREHGHVEGAEPYQTVYASDHEAVSVFTQRGSLDWDALPPEGRHDLDGKPIWVDAAEQLVLVETGDSALIIVGLTPGELAVPLQSLPRRSQGLFSQLRDGAAALSGQMGFVAVG